MNLICKHCRNAKPLTVREARAWENAGLPFVCDACLGLNIKKAATASIITKAEADTRAFQHNQINPATWLSPTSSKPSVPI